MSKPTLEVTYRDQLDSVSNDCGACKLAVEKGEFLLLELVQGLEEVGIGVGRVVGEEYLDRWRCTVY